MSAAPVLAPNQLEAWLRDDKDRLSGGGVVLLHASPAPGTPLFSGEIGGTKTTVRVSRSPLEIRSWMVEPPPGLLVVLTGCDLSALGEDVVGRAVGRKVHRVRPWSLACRLFGATQPSADLVRHRNIADAIVELEPVGGYPKVTSRVLDYDTAAAALVKAALRVPDDVDDLAGLLALWTKPEPAGRVADARGELLDALIPVMADRYGPGLEPVLAAMDSGHASDLVPWGLVAQVAYAKDAEDVAPRVRLDTLLGGETLDAEAYRAWADAAAAAVREPEDAAKAAAWIERAEALVRDLHANKLVHHSDLLPSGFEQRIGLAARAIRAWYEDVESDALASQAHTAIEHAVRHERARQHDSPRVARLRMAARMVRRRSFQLTGLTDLPGAAATYLNDGAWLDAARTEVSRSDTNPELAELCRDLTAAADAARRNDSESFAALAPGASGPVPGSLLGVEDVLERVVAPLAQTTPVLLVVLDGVGLPTFTDVVESLELRGWAGMQRVGESSPPLAVAALPTVTEVSRTSLLAGTLRTGDDASERRAFRDHTALRAVSKPHVPPVLFHKRSLRRGGLDTLPTELLDAVVDEQQRVVGVVINNVDERLKDVTQPIHGWSLGELDPLGPVLDEARRVGRAVVLTADHGHVLDRGAEARPHGGGGERWRLAGDPARDGEVAMHGPRVVVDSNRAVLASWEQVHYGTIRNGYHGGFTPQELFVPALVLSIDDIDGWADIGISPPPWWHHRPATDQPKTPARALAQAKPIQQSIFDEPSEPELTVTWIDELLQLSLYVERRGSPRIRISDDEVRRLLGVLDSMGTMAVDLERLADETGLARARILRYVAQLQDLLNVDGYGVVTVREGDVRFDRPLLERQFGLTQ